jgi:hypothetical protein
MNPSALRSPRTFALLAALAVWLPAPDARAQGGSHGAIIGNVLDQNGTPLKGVKISARSETQIGGAKVTYTSDEGSFRLVGLIPGAFEITASAPQLRTVVQRGIAVGINAPAEVDLVLEVETAVEEVKVVEKAPIVSTTTAVVKEVFDEEFIDNIPLDVKSTAENTVAGMVPGAVEPGWRQVRFRGGGLKDSHFLVEGFYMNGQRSTMKAMAAVEVLSAGQGADNASTPGGVINMVTKSGSNKLEFDINAFAEDKALEFFLDESDNPERSYFYQINPNVSGPIVKDRLWYFVNLETRFESRASEADALGIAATPPPRSYYNVRGSGKLTWQVTPRNKLVSFNNFNSSHDRNYRQGYSPYHEPEAQPRTDNLDVFTGLIWESLLADNVFLKSQAGLQRFWNDTGPKQCDDLPVDCDHVVPIINSYPRESRLQNFDAHTQRIQDRVQIINTLEFFPSTRRFGDHDVKMKVDYYTESDERAEATPGDKILRYTGQAYDRQTEYYANDPRLEPARYGWFIRRNSAMKVVSSLNDQWRPTRYVTLTPGVAFTWARAGNSLGDQPLEGSAFTPHMAAAYDPLHDGRTVLRGSFNGYVDVGATELGRHSLGSRISQTCRWDETTQSFSRECTYSGGASSRTFGLPCGPSGVDERGRDCRERLVIPRTWEATAGAEREIVQGVGLGADFVYRRYVNQYETRETNRIWNASGTALDTGGGFRNGKAQTIDDMATPEGAERRYLGVTGALHKREGRLKTSAAYTWSQLEGTVLDGTGNAWGNNPGRDIYLYGYLPDDARHNVKITMTFSWTQWLSTGLLYNYLSGRPYQRRFRNDVTGAFEDFRARVGVNPGSNINDPGDDRPLRRPDLQTVNLQTRVNLKPLTGIYLDVYADVLNVLALRTPTSFVENDGPGWGSPAGGRFSPFRLRLGFRYKY